MSDELQFDDAAPQSTDETLSPHCASCERELRDTYFLANGAMICSECHTLLAAEAPGGSGAARFARALGFGALGGAIGAGIYFGILKLSGYEVGLVAIVVGFLVGGGVRLGAGGRGGWLYQALAVAITYGSIVATYVPFIVDEIDAMIAQEAAALTTDAEAPRVTILQDESLWLDGNPITTDQLRAELAAVSATAPAVLYYRERIDSEPPPVAEEVASAIEELGLERTNFTDPEFEEPLLLLDGMTGADVGSQLLMGGMLLFFAAASPFAGLPENLIGLAIIGFALYQAWSMNRREKLEIEGPLELADG